jgi:hypothetical protein
VPLKVRDIIRIIEEDGWEHVRTRGSHQQYKHPGNRAWSRSPVSRAGTCRLGWSEAS